MPEEVAVIAVMSLAAVTALGFGLMRSINRHLERKWRVERRLDDDHVVPELDELRSRVDNVEDLQARVMELEERVDFTERLLAEGKDRNTLRADS